MGAQCSRGAQKYPPSGDRDDSRRNSNRSPRTNASFEAIPLRFFGGRSAAPHHATSGATSGSATFVRPSGRTMRVSYAARSVARPGQDQDRFAVRVAPKKMQTMVVGVFDGHSCEPLSGRAHAENAARMLPTELLQCKRAADKLEKKLKKAEAREARGAKPSLQAQASTCSLPPSLQAQASTGMLHNSNIDLLELAQHGGSGKITRAPSNRMSSRSASFFVQSDTALIGRSAASYLTGMVRRVFLKYQQQCEQRYQSIEGRLYKMKDDLERELGESVDIELPQEGGTTATCAIVDGSNVTIAWVGDSCAIMGQRSYPRTTFKVKMLTKAHNLMSGSERERSQRRGGKVVHLGNSNDRIAVSGVEGSLNVTRSLGDSPFHKSDIVSSTPEITTHKLRSLDRFLIVASDGVWDHLEHAEVVQIVGSMLEQFRVLGISDEEIANAASVKIFELLHEKQGNALADDCSIVILFFYFDGDSCGGATTESDTGTENS